MNADVVEVDVEVVEVSAGCGGGDGGGGGETVAEAARRVAPRLLSESIQLAVFRQRAAVLGSRRQLRETDVAELRPVAEGGAGLGVTGCVC